MNGKTPPCATHQALRVKEPPDAVLELVEEHGVERRAELQTQQIFDVGPHVQAHPLVPTHQQRQEAVQEAAQRRFIGGGRRGGKVCRHLAGHHGDHGVFALCHGAHRRAVGDWTRGVVLLETHPTQGTQEAGHVDPLLSERKRQKEKRPALKVEERSPRSENRRTCLCRSKVKTSMKKD